MGVAAGRKKKNKIVGELQVEVYRQICEMMNWVENNEPKYFGELWVHALENRKDWVHVLRKKNQNYLMKEYIRSINRVWKRDKHKKQI